MADLSVLQEAAQTYIQAVLAEFPEAANMGLAVITDLNGTEYGVTLATAEQMRPVGMGPVEPTDVTATTFEGDALPEIQRNVDESEPDTEVSPEEEVTDTPVSDTTDA